MLQKQIVTLNGRTVKYLQIQVETGALGVSFPAIKLSCKICFSVILTSYAPCLKPCKFYFRYEFFAFSRTENLDLPAELNACRVPCKARIHLPSTKMSNRDVKVL